MPSNRNPNLLPTTWPPFSPAPQRALIRERTIPRFVDSYVVEHGRHSLQVHAVLYRDLQNLLQREALLTVTARALEIVTRGMHTERRSQSQADDPSGSLRVRQRFLAGLTRHQRWNVSDALDFQSDLKMYEDLIARAATRAARASPSKPPIIPSWIAAASFSIHPSSKKLASPPAAPFKDFGNPLRTNRGVHPQRNLSIKLAAVSLAFHSLIAATQSANQIHDFLYFHRRPVRQYLRHSLHHLVGVIPHAHDRVGPMLRRVLQQYLVSLFSCLFRKARSVSKYFRR